MHFKSIIFDLDGVILDSEGLHAEAKRITLNHFNIAYSENIFSDFKGRPDTAFFEYVSDILAPGKWSSGELDNYKYGIYRDISGQIGLVPGAIEFVRAMRKRFRHMGLVTSARRRDVEIADKVHDFMKWFDVVILGDHTEDHKPHSAPYLLALEKLHTDAKYTIVIEDSPNGIISACGAGCHVIGITTNFSSGALTKAGASVIANSFDEIAEMPEM
jgi:beta-phosphoglucomutase